MPADRNECASNKGDDGIAVHGRQLPSCIQDHHSRTLYRHTCRQDTTSHHDQSARLGRRLKLADSLNVPGRYEQYKRRVLLDYALVAGQHLVFFTRMRAAGD